MTPELVPIEVSDETVRWAFGEFLSLARTTTWFLNGMFVAIIIRVGSRPACDMMLGMADGLSKVISSWRKP